MNNSGFKYNNFDLIRLFAALQVAHYHVFYIMGIDTSTAHNFLTKILGLFPGVPIFFFISGFLISKSWESNRSIKNYTLNRVLRIYPALVFAVTLSFVLIYLSGYFEIASPSLVEKVKLYFAKVTILQFYNPDFMRGYGDGVLNGSLWTITVELQFYFLVPALYISFKLIPAKRINLYLVFLIIIFMLLNRCYEILKAYHADHILFKLVGVSFIPWFYMFLCGVFVQRNFDYFHGFFKNKFLIFFPIYLITAYLLSKLGWGFGNSVHPIIFFLLLSVIFSAAYSHTSKSKQLLKGVDASYGIYIYHMPIVNFMIDLSLAFAK